MEKEITYTSEFVHMALLEEIIDDISKETLMISVILPDGEYINRVYTRLTELDKKNKEKQRAYNSNLYAYVELDELEKSLIKTEVFSMLNGESPATRITFLDSKDFLKLELQEHYINEESVIQLTTKVVNQNNPILYGEKEVNYFLCRPFVTGINIVLLKQIIKKKNIAVNLSLETQDNRQKLVLRNCWLVSMFS